MEPIVASVSGQKRAPLNAATLMYMGAYFTRVTIDFEVAQDPLDSELYDVFGSLPLDRNRVEDFFFRRIMAGKDSVEEIRAAIERIKPLAITPGSFRGTYIDLVKQALPPGAPGRKRKLRETDLPQLAELSDNLFHPIWKFLVLRKQVPTRAVPECLEFLASEHPTQVKYVVEHLQQFEGLLQNTKLLRKAKTEKARSRLIADAMAGTSFTLKPSYAIRKANEARRRRAAGTFRPKPQN